MTPLSWALGPLLLGPRLALRALDDLHALASAGGDATQLLASLEESAREVQAQMDRALILAEQIEQRGEEAVERIDALMTFGATVLEEAERIHVSAQEVAERGAEIAAALPLLQRAVELADPLEGAVERVGRIVDRLPGGRPRAPRGS